jgi:dihydropteroate synthase
VHLAVKDTNFCKNHTWNIRGELIDFSTPKIMGIVNCTPDSFYAASRQQHASAVINYVTKMVAEGADMLDVGGYSSRPGANDVSEDEELNRVLPVITEIQKQFPKLPISIDTFRTNVAEKALSAGANMVNDISAGSLDHTMFDMIRAAQVPYIIMHMRGTPQTMQQQTYYKQITMDVVRELSEKLFDLRLKGVNDIAIDPGFGFSKTLAQNYELLNELDLFEPLDCPLLVGVSRKSMLYKALDTTAEDALSATIAANTIALMKGANILRVHDVKPAVEARQIVTFTQNPSLLVE